MTGKKKGENEEAQKEGGRKRKEDRRLRIGEERQQQHESGMESSAYRVLAFNLYSNTTK